MFTVAFYNTENLFDIFNDPKTLDDDFTPQGKRKWTQNRYENKIGKIAMTISRIGLDETGYPPSLVGLAEVENDVVVQDLIKNKYLGEENYDFVHFDSQDERGIDVALIYNKHVFFPEHSEPLHPPMIYDGGGRDLTRDILYVKGKLYHRRIHVFVVHMPSKREENYNLAKREAIAQKLWHKIEDISREEKNPYIIVLGDFNSDPTTDTLKKYLKGQHQKPKSSELSFFNPMELLVRDGHFTTVHRKDWLLFDQMLFSTAFFSAYASPTLVGTQVFNPYFLQEWNHKYRFQPFRTYVGRKYLGGYSDHFPIYSILKI
ncbi:MAG: endonuclease [Flavobacteriaceae bacterium]|nr:endonuclease [Flavobacteriaceae bacterium]